MSPSALLRLPPSLPDASRSVRDYLGVRSCIYSSSAVGSGLGLGVVQLFLSLLSFLSHFHWHYQSVVCLPFVSTACILYHCPECSLPSFVSLACILLPLPRASLIWLAIGTYLSTSIVHTSFCFSLAYILPRGTGPLWLAVGTSYLSTSIVHTCTSFCLSLAYVLPRGM